MSPPGPPGLIPLVLGVTGHRDLHPGDLEPLGATVTALLEQLRRKLPHTPLLLLTPLAEGADRLVAMAALQQGAELAVTLPFSAEDYRRDFPASVTEFDRLLEHPRTVRRIEPPPLGGECGSDRDLGYARVGAFVARHSHILIALWDGVASDRIGGTSQVVRYRRTGRLQLPDPAADRLEQVPLPFGLVTTPLEPPETGPVYHVVTPRVGHPSPDNPFAGRWLLPGEAESDGLPPGLGASLARLEVFNAEAVRLAGRAPGTVAEAEGQLAGSGETLPAEVSGIRQAFALADALSLRYQRETFAVLRALYWLVLLAVICFEAYGHLSAPGDPRTIGFLAAYFAVLGIADLLYLVLRRRQSQNRYQDYRALAEGLRVQFYWRLAGLAHSAADFYLRKQRDELAWIRDALRGWGVRAPVPAEGDVSSLARRWVEDQRSYFVAATRRERARLQRYRSVAGGVIVASVVGSLPTILDTVRHEAAGPADWLGALQVPLLAVSLVLAWHLAFKGSQMVRDGRGRGFRALIGEVRPFLVSAILGIGFLTLMRLAPAWAGRRWPLLPSDPHPWVVVALGLITVVGALVHSYTEKRAFGEHARQYARMAEIFSRAGERMAALLHDGKEARARELALELGKEALAEHGDWVILHRERPIELPKAKL